MTGTIAGTIPFAAVNHATYDGVGNYWGTQTRFFQGVSRVTFEGTYTVNPDCTGTKTTSSYDKDGNLINTVTQDFVLVNDAKELIEIVTSNTKFDGTLIPTLMTGNSKRIFPESDNPGRHLGNCGH
jgi:hypothetical protein